MGSSDVALLRDFAIYNRWGQEVFHVANAQPNDTKYGWNGWVHGQKPLPDTYTYFVTVVFTDGRVEVMRGVVEVLL